ncbi:hypothetical protein [Brevundimonas sp.]|uniref:hypothetical protein n=1 Tax=Brevundimonas sp. TaxID=1871086 RepID=UPI0027378BC2|nr:hypothetical protein [Brevundimonas sp.]MDP3801377.1 hypothetical protein [Brevundimonas sp.]
MAARKKIIAILMASAGLAGCTSDPAFWDAVAQGLDQAAYEIASQPVCSWYTDRYGVVRQSCAPAYVANAPTYYPPAPRYRDRDRHRDQDRGRRRDHDGRRDHHRDDNDRRDGRRGPKGGG